VREHGAGAYGDSRSEDPHEEVDWNLVKQEGVRAALGSAEEDYIARV